MPNINIDVDDKTLWSWREAKTKLKAKNNLDCLKKLLILLEKVG
jgi:hypothetical protein